jgi:hypothetical protein
MSIDRTFFTIDILIKYIQIETISYTLSFFFLSLSLFY